MEVNNVPTPFSGNDKPVNSAAYNNALAQSEFSSDTAHPRTLYVGNLDPTITEDFIHTLFSPFGPISGLKLIKDNVNDPYCFIEFAEHSGANSAILTMNKRVCLDREIKVNWATSPNTGGPKQDTSRHFHIFVGDLSPEIETQQLRDAFSPFGEISDCRVVRDPHTAKSKGYGFVSFVKKQDAETAISGMNQQWLGSKAIRTNWATRKPPTTKPETQIGPNVFNNRHLNFEEVFNQTSPNNCTVYCGGISNGLCDELIQQTFNRFGPIQEIRVFKEKGYAFIKFINKEVATNAIVSMHNQEVMGQVVKCSWGKEAGENNNNNNSNLAVQAQLAQSFASPSLMYPYGQQMPPGLWYPNAAPLPPYTVQGVQGVQGNMQYPFNQYFAQSNQANLPFNSPSLGMPLNPTWQGAGNSLQNLPNSHHLPPSYPMQGYHAQ